MESFLGFIFFNYYHNEKEHLQKEIFLEMKNYSFLLEGDQFTIDIVEKKHQNLYELLMDTQHLYILTPLLDDTHTLMKITYPKHQYDQQLNNIMQKLLLNFALLTLINMTIALLFSLYALSPLKRSLILMQEFMKDIIHDLNTPISSMILNLKMIPKSSPEIKTLEQSVKILASLHKNLDNYINTTQLHKTHFSLTDTLKTQQSFFQSIYDYIEWDTNLEEVCIYSSQDSIERILYNLLNNACKYNTTQGFIDISLSQERLTIINDSYGIKHPDRVFERFYKESDRGLGIGLHIVAKLSRELDLKTTLKSDDTKVEVTIDLSKTIIK
jgi:signal transduction histidine kinase